MDPGVGVDTPGQGAEAALGDVHAVEAHAAPAPRLGQVGQVPLGEVVDDHDLVALGLEPVDQVGAEEASPTGHDDEHPDSLLWPVAADLPK